MIKAYILHTVTLGSDEPNDRTAKKYLKKKKDTSENIMHTIWYRPARGRPLKWESSKVLFYLWKLMFSGSQVGDI